MTTSMWFVWLLRGDIRKGEPIDSDEGQREFVVWWFLWGHEEYSRTGPRRRSIWRSRWSRSWSRAVRCRGCCGGCSVPAGPAEAVRRRHRRRQGGIFRLVQSEWQAGATDRAAAAGLCRAVVPTAGPPRRRRIAKRGGAACRDGRTGNPIPGGASSDPRVFRWRAGDRNRQPPRGAGGAISRRPVRRKPRRLRLRRTRHRRRRADAVGVARRGRGRACRHRRPDPGAHQKP